MTLEARRHFLISNVLAIQRKTEQVYENHVKLVKWEKNFYIQIYYIGLFRTVSGKNLFFEKYHCKAWDFKGFWRNVVQKFDFFNLEVRLDEYKI
ncbi:hypothetical protein J2X07_002540 [Fictibacillus barbaricus]|uniref:Uncharacterized protein n=1 Tax=Fictibacillus barbaricus TaxID=182136 RepID=A0ABU1U244_9BACL|nr:hypothetical protein [Fictibacillus barbaricus]